MPHTTATIGTLLLTITTLMGCQDTYPKYSIENGVIDNSTMQKIADDRENGGRLLYMDMYTPPSRTPHDITLKYFYSRERNRIINGDYADVLTVSQRGEVTPELLDAALTFIDIKRDGIVDSLNFDAEYLYDRDGKQKPHFENRTYTMPLNRDDLKTEASRLYQALQEKL